MKTKSYLIDDTTYNIPLPVAERMKELEQEFNMLREDYVELKKENGHLLVVISRLEGACDE